MAKISLWNNAPPASFQAPKWQKLSKFIVYFCVVRSFEKEDFLENARILSCFAQFKSVLFNILRVFDLSVEVTVRVSTHVVVIVTEKQAQ